MPKCSYCNNDYAEGEMSLNTWKGSGREHVIFHYCSNDCKNRLEAFADFANRNAKKFLRLLLIDILLLFLLLFLALILDDKRDLPVIFGIPLLLLGLSLFKYPFPTPETTKKLGLKKSIEILKFSGSGFILISLILMVLRLIQIIS